MIACRRPKQKQLLWALIPQLIFRNMTKLIHPPLTLFFLKKAATTAGGTELVWGLLKFLSLPPGISRRSAQMTRRVNLLDSYWCAALNVSRRGRDPENPLRPVFFFFLFSVRSHRRSNWLAATAMRRFGTGGGDLTANHPCDCRELPSGSLRERFLLGRRRPSSLCKQKVLTGIQTLTGSRLIKLPEVTCSVCCLALVLINFRRKHEAVLRIFLCLLFFFSSRRSGECETKRGTSAQRPSAKIGKGCSSPFKRLNSPRLPLASFILK